MIPDEVPQRIRKNARYPDAEGEEWPSWSKIEAIELIETLTSSTVVVREVQIFELVSTDLVPLDLYWDMYTTVGDTGSERAAKSQAAAVAFIRQLGDGNAMYIGIRFSYQDDAA